MAKKPAEKPKNQNQSVIIAVLITAIALMAVFIILILTGVIKLGSATMPDFNGVPGQIGGFEGGNPGDGAPGQNTGTSSNSLVDNPNPRVKVNGKLAQAGNLEFYLPSKFEAASNSGKNGVYTFNLINDDGWATVTVYIEKTSLTPMQYLLSQSPTLEETDSNYEINGTSWVQAENGSMLAYATTYGDQVYALIYTVKLDSDATSEAMSMIPKTLYFSKIYQK
ncbi:hypothetical protein IJI94_00130 [Candidatus Saccharibacteria bacterium]|nr:hypothetical protein [Candidatus Saccharibacteria bacterium]